MGRVARAARRWWGQASSWTRRHVALEGDWSALGMLGENAASVLESLAARSYLAGPDPELAAAAKIVGLALDGRPEALAFVQDHRNEMAIDAAVTAACLLDQGDVSRATSALWAHVREGDGHAYHVLSAMCVLGAKPACCCSGGDDLTYVYDAEKALLGPDYAADSIAGYVDHYARRKLGTPRLPPAAYAQALVSTGIVPPGVRRGSRTHQRWVNEQSNFYGVPPGI